MKEKLDEFMAVQDMFNYKTQQLEETANEMYKAENALFKAIEDANEKQPFLKEGNKVYEIHFLQYKIRVVDGRVTEVKRLNPILVEL